MNAWSRVTLAGPDRRVDIVLPAAETVGAIMPEILELLGDQRESPPRLRHLVTHTGRVLDAGASLADQRIADGAVLWVVRAEEPLPAPVVHEVPEVVGDALEGHLWRWGPRSRRAVSTGAVVVLASAVCVLAHESLAGGRGVAVGCALAALLLLGGIAVGLGWREPLGTAMSLAGGASAGLTVWFAADHYDWAEWGRWAGLALTAAVMVALLGPTTPLGRGGLIGGAMASVLAVTGTVCEGAGLSLARTSAVLAIACVILLSVVLRIALTLSGLTSLDDRRGGDMVTRGDVMGALAGAHRSLVIATGAVTVAATVAGLGALTDFDAWTAALTALLALVVAGRARLFPLVLEKAALLSSATVITAGLAWVWTDRVSWGIAPALGMLLGCLVVPVVTLTAEPPEHVRARLRRLMNRVEAAAVVAIIPVAIGSFGTYERLLDTFR